ncbi:hypothetical protein CMMCAS02_02340 [Clavibacter michiganensis subsp. michiganensis]|nr:hypothetical protein CMMCAS02_02340 [Clavibacter michiganensis subsp. michiganensis]OUD88603.1 hypothetical protein CMMCAS03_12615 [Clavibacter michiganensis subsp. michiganensis]
MSGKKSEMTKKDERRNKKVLARSQNVARRPTGDPPAASADEIWSRITALTESVVTTTSQTREPTIRKRGSSRKKNKRRRLVLLLDILGVAAWLFAIVKLFFTDIDRLIISYVAPEYIWLSDIRAIVALCLIALVLLLVKRRTLGLAVAYVAGYPLVLLFWKLPKYVLKQKSVTFAIGLAGLVVSAFARVKFVVCALAIALLATFVITASNTKGLVLAASACLVATLVWSLVVTAKDMLNASVFGAAQEQFVGAVFRRNFIELLISPVQPDKASIHDWTADDATKYRDAAGLTLLVHRLLYVWAYALDQYRKSATIVVANVATIVVAVVQIVYVFAVANYGVWKVAGEQYRFAVEPSWLVFCYYSLVAMGAGEIDALLPNGTYAFALKVGNAVLGIGGVLGLIGSILLGYRAQKTAEVSDQAVAMLTEKAAELDAHSERQYHEGLHGLETRLEEAGWGMKWLNKWLLEAVPSGWKSKRP